MFRNTFFGWRVTAGAFVLAIFGWGLGFYSLPIFLGTIRETRGWPLGTISGAMTLHLLVGSLMAARLPLLHARIGLARYTQLGAVLISVGLVGWALAWEPWQLYVAAILSGAGWSSMSAVAINAIVSPWFIRARPAALGMAYNGGSIGGVLFSPLWVLAIATLGFAYAAATLSLAAALIIWVIAATLFAKTPDQMGLRPDGDAQGATVVQVTSPLARPLPGRLLWRDRGFLTLTAAMALSLLAQLGLVSHLFSLLIPAFGTYYAGLGVALITAMAVVGRLLIGWLMPLDADRRVVTCIGYGTQLAGSLAFLAADGTSVPLLLLGLILFGAGFGNATSLPPLVAQIEFVREEVPRVVALVVGIGQAVFAFGPATFGLIRELSAPMEGASSGAAPWVFIAAAVLQGLAIAAMLLGRRSSQ
ncbi:MAG TPA: MFS transporter [Hyphomicrobiaceae bacterium]|nr:MFS transporter [Hyphomicrobiaceae bacterium]